MSSYDEQFKAFTVFGYGRASTSHQVLSTDQQHAAVKDAFLARKAIDHTWANVQWGGFFADEATGRESCFRQRHNGSLLLAACKPGDMIVVSNFDRLLAGVVDAFETSEYVRHNNLNLWILDFGGMQVDTSTPLGETFFIIMAQLKRLERREIGRRTKDSSAHRRRIGRPYTGKTPVGWRHVAVRVPNVPSLQRYLKPDHVSRRLAREILGVKERGKLTYTQAAQLCNSLGLKQKNGRRWTTPTFIAWCRAAESDFPLPNGSHDPCPIPAEAEPVLIETISPDA